MSGRFQKVVGLGMGLKLVAGSFTSGPAQHANHRWTMTIGGYPGTPSPRQGDRLSLRIDASNQSLGRIMWDRKFERILVAIADPSAGLNKAVRRAGALAHKSVTLSEAAYSFWS